MKGIGKKRGVKILDQKCEEDYEPLLLKMFQNIYPSINITTNGALTERNIRSFLSSDVQFERICVVFFSTSFLHTHLSSLMQSKHVDACSYISWILLSH
jgi:hypothetical protein